MPAKISKEIRQRISEMNQTLSVKEILAKLIAEGIKISDRSIYNIIKENKNVKEKNESFVSYEGTFDEFNESFGEERRYTGKDKRMETRI